MDINYINELLNYCNKMLAINQKQIKKILTLQKDYILNPKKYNRCHYIYLSKNCNKWYYIGAIKVLEVLKEEVERTRNG